MAASILFRFLGPVQGNFWVKRFVRRGTPKIRKKKVALVGPDRKEEVRHEKLDFDKKKVRSFHNFNIGRLSDTKIFSSLYD